MSLEGGDMSSNLSCSFESSDIGSWLVPYIAQVESKRGNFLIGINIKTKLQIPNSWDDVILIDFYFRVF